MKAFYRVALLMLCISLGSILVACGPTTVSEGKIQDDVIAQFTAQYDAYNFQSVDVSIERQEQEKNIAETWGQVSATTNALTLSCPYYIKYTVDNKQWQRAQIRFGNTETEITIDNITEAQLEADIGPKLLQEYCNANLSIADVRINDSVVDFDSLENTVTCQITVSEPDAEGWFMIEASYTLGDYTWQLNDWAITNTEQNVIACSLDEEIAKTTMANLYAEYYPDEKISECVLTDISFDSENGRAGLVFQIQQKFGYYSQCKRATCWYDYSLRNGWSGASYTPNMEDEYVGTWDVLGEWTYSDSANDVWVNIIGVDGNEITYEYEIDCRVPYESSWYGLSTEILMISSDGERTDSLRKVDDEDYAFRFPITDSASSCNLYLYPYKGVTFDGRIWNEDDTYILSYYDTEKSESVLDEEFADWPESSILLYDEPVIYHLQGLNLTSSSFDYGEKDLNDGESSGETVHHNVMYYADDDNEGAASNTYNLYGKYRTLTGTVFLRQGAPLGNSAKVNIYGDGTLLYSFDAITFSETCYTEDFSIDVTDVRELTVELTGETYRRSSFLVSYDDALIGLAELTAYIAEDS